MKPITLSIAQMEAIIAAAKEKRQSDTSFSEVVEIYRFKESDTHTGADDVGCYIKSGYADCSSTLIYRGK